METNAAVAALAALAHAWRLSAFRRLVEVGPEGWPAGHIGDRLSLRPSSLSLRLKYLSGARLVHPRQQGRFVIYSADHSAMNALAGVLTGNCCAADTMPDVGENTMPEKLKVLFLCTGNACRSQMSEGWARHLKGSIIEAYSAGVAPHGVDPRAVRVMAEAGVDISGNTSKHLDDLRDVNFDYVVTVCDNAAESCPVFPGRVKKVHRSFQDPPRLAEEAATEEAALAYYRRVRDEIRAFVETLPGVLRQI